MQDWHAIFLSRRRLPRDLTTFELEAFFTFVGAERQALVLQALQRHEQMLAMAIRREVEPLILAEWSATLNRPHDSGTTTQTWLWSAPVKHSTRQIEEVLARMRHFRHQNQAEAI